MFFMEQSAVTRRAWRRSSLLPVKSQNYTFKELFSKGPQRYNIKYFRATTS